MKKLRKIILVIVFALLVLGMNRETFAIEGEENTDNYSKLYREYLNLSDEEKSKLAVIPRKYDVSMDVLYRRQAENKIKSAFANMFGLRKAPETQTLPSSFILLKDENTDIECEQYGGIDIVIENQGNEGLCWAFASITSLETNLALKGKNYDFSEKHVDYLTSRDFGGDRNLGEGGYFQTFAEYAFNEYGPVLEEEVPYKKNYNEEEYEYLFNLNPSVYVIGTIDFPTIYKKNNSIYGENDENYTDEDINLFRTAIKEHIIENGGVFASVNSSEIDKYKDKEVLNYNGESFSSNHAVTIIGWDDEFSPENFPEESRPKNKGAYIALNSWGENWGNDGIFYISYEDMMIEVNMSGFMEVKSEIQKDMSISFEDQNLYNAIKQHINSENAIFDDNNKRIDCSGDVIHNIKDLNLSNNNILNLKGIEQFYNLRKLDLSNNNIEDINYLKDMKCLKKLYLDNNNISDIRFLENLRNLIELDLSNNNIKDISSLPHLNHYLKLVLSNNPIENFGSTVKMAKEVYIDNCNIDDEKLLKIYKLFSFNRMLSIRNNNITDLTSFKPKFYDEKAIDASGNTNLNLSNIPFIGSLYLRNCNINNIEEIARNFKGSSLDLSYNPLEDITPFKDKYLGTLDISYTNVSDISYLNNIYYLKISGIQNIEGLESLDKLRKLEMNNCNLSNEVLRQIIQNLKELSLLSIDNNKITTLESLQNCTSLVQLYANNNQISDISGISSIQDLYISNNEISDISYLSGLRQLRCLDISNNPITDLSYINADLMDKVIANNQGISSKINIEKGKETILNVPPIMNKAFKNGMYRAEVKFICENCSINSIATKVILKSDDLGEKHAKITVEGGNFDGITYTVNYNTVENINVTDIRIKKEASKKYYIENENFDATDLVVEVTYENGVTEKTTDYTLVNNENLVGGQENVIIRSNKNPEIETTHAIKVYGENDIEEIQFEDEWLYNDIKSKKPFGEWARILNILRYDDGNKVLYIPKEDIERITMIEQISSDVSNISGLEKFSKLQNINLRYNPKITSVDNLVVLENLKSINLNGNNINSIKNLIEKESLNTIHCTSGNNDFYKIDANMVELPKYIYESVKLQEGVTIEANVRYIGYNNNEEKIINVELDDENKVAKVELDKEITEEHGPGNRAITVQIKGGKTNGSTHQILYQVVVELQKIEVTTEAGKLSYRVGQNFDPSWMKIMATYNNGESKEITDYTILDGNNLTQDKKEVTISYEENGITKTTTQSISVYTEDDLVNVSFPDNNLYNEIKTTYALQNNLREVRRNLVVDYNDETNTVQMVKDTLETVDNLFLMQKDITDLTGIRYFTGLRIIDLSFNTNLKTADELLQLDKLKIVDIHVTEVEDVKNLINKENIEQIILRKHEQNIINSTIEEIELPEFIYQAVTEEEGVTAKANIYYDTFSPEDGEYYTKIDGEKEATEIIIDRENKKAIARLNRQVTSEHDEGIRGLEVKIEGGKCNGALYIAFYNNIEEIKVEKAPDRTHYIVGQSFDRTGMKLMATYRDRSVSEINNYTVLDGDTLQEGQNFVTMSYTENGLTKTTTQEIIVRNEEDEKIINDDSNYYTDETKILGISPDTSISEFINNFNETYRIIVIKNNSEVTEGAIGTGMEIQVLENDEEKARLTAIVIGDTDGDGKANVKDMVKINNYRLYGTITNFGEIYQTAADVNKDGKIDVKDMIRINNYRLYNTSLVN